MQHFTFKRGELYVLLLMAVFMGGGGIFAGLLSAEDKNAKNNADEASILASIESYVAAYNQGDAKAVAEHWSDTAEWTSPTGERFQGKEEIEKQLGILFAKNKGARIEVINPSIRFVSPDVAAERGTVRVIQPKQAPEDSTYIAIHVRKAGKWKLDSVHETSVPDEPAASSQLQELSFLIGDWIDENPESTLEATVTWAKNKTFLNYAFKVSVPGTEDLDGTQIIGWDPVRQTIRSWMFDSDGGFGEGTWSRKDNAWVVKFSQTLADGRTASATNVYTMVDGDTLAWKSIGRKLDGEFLPNVDEVKIVRKTSATKSPSEGAKTALQSGQ